MDIHQLTFFDLFNNIDIREGFNKFVEVGGFDKFSI